MDSKSVYSIFDRAVKKFIEIEAGNILTGISERNLCGRLALNLQRQADELGLIGYFADVEYNRKQNGKIKTILDEKKRVVRVTCDLIVHARGEKSPDNLIAIEMKKSGHSQQEKESDRMRLRALTKTLRNNVWSYDGETYPEHVAGYLLGVYIEVDADRKNCLLEYYIVGSRFLRSEITF